MKTEVALACCLLFTNIPAIASVITTDETAFFAAYGSPSKIIDFTTLKDGTDYVSTSTAHLYINDVTHTSGGKYEVWEYGWIDDFLIRSTNGSLFHQVTRWDGSSIGINSLAAPRLSILSLSNASPISLLITSDTYNGFIGIIPDSIADTHFQIYYPNLRVQEFRASYSQNMAISEPPVFSLLLLGGLIIGIKKRITS